jgi:hypothetical protein
MVKSETPKVEAQPPKLLAEAGEAGPRRAERIVYPENPRYRRIRFVSVLMDQSVTLPNGFRIGLDPLLGLVPGLGDALCTLVSCYLVYEAARLGLRKRVLAQMLGNILLDAATGSVPLVGDVVDAFWKANMRNLRLVDRHYHPALPERPAGRIALWMTGVLAMFLAGIAGLMYFVVKLVLLLFSALWG